MKDASLRHYRKQILTQKELSNVCDFLQEKLKLDYYLLTRIVSQENACKDDAYYLMFVGSLDSKYKYKYKYQLWVLRSKVLQIIKIFKTQFSNLLKTH
jgi:hypothetical protein